MTVSMLATFSPWNLPITATPMAFLPHGLFNGIAIYKLNLLDITPWPPSTCWTGSRTATSFE